MNAMGKTDLALQMEAMGKAARTAAKTLALAPAQQKNEALLAMAAGVRAASGAILAANAEDVAAGTASGLKGSFIDRLTLNSARLEAMAKGLEEIAALPDPVGAVMAEWMRPNGLKFQRVRVPIGVVGIIYESRPNVTADAGGLCLKSGNAAILRGGSDGFRTSSAIIGALRTGLAASGLPESAIQMVPSADRAAVGMMLEGLGGSLDLIVPRGGKSLVARVQQEARVPVFSHLEGICHVYVHRDAEPDMAKRIVFNAKMRRTGVCGAAEAILVDRAYPDLAGLVRVLMDAGCEVRGDDSVLATGLKVTRAAEEDWGKEYLDAIVAMRVVDGVEEAIAHISRFGSQHTDAIVTRNAGAAETFLNEVDSAIVLHNASTQFADGGEFGFGAEIGIATGKLHARGPVGVEQLTTFKYKVRGEGQIRP